MSAISEFRIIETSKLNALRDHAEVKIVSGFFTKKKIDNYPEYLNSNSRMLNSFSYTGYTFATLLPFLAENKDINLLSNQHDEIATAISQRRENSTIILDYSQRQAYLDKLDAATFSKDELIAFNTEFSGEESPEFGEAALAGIKALKESLEQIKNENEVVLLSIL